MTEQHALSQVYLDANATTPVLDKAAAAALVTMETLFGNPSSSHITGLQAKQLMERTREKAKQVLGSGQGKVIFTSGATEGIQTGILSALCAAKKRHSITSKSTILYGATEHKAVPQSLQHWNQVLEINAEIKAIPVDNKGNLDTDFIAEHVPSALMICTMAVNNETGVYQDLNALEQIIRKNNPAVFWMVDCVQALGKQQLNLAATTIDYAPFSGHKLYAPKGIGFVYIRDNAPFTPFIAGGGQESGLRSGTENLPGLAALEVIFDQLLNDTDSCFVDVQTLNHYREQLAAALKDAFPTIVFNNSFENSVPTTLNFAILGFTSKEIMDLFDAANIRVSSGSACSSAVTRSFVLDAMGLPIWQSEAAIRMSFGPATTADEIATACERIAYCAKALGHSCLLHNDNEISEKTVLDGLIQFKVGGACCWLFAESTSKTAVVIDPLPELVERINTLLECQQYTLVAALDTHGHADHQSSATQLNCQQQACDQLGWPASSDTIKYQGHTLPSIQIGNYTLAKAATPGHTDDSVSFLLLDRQSEQPTVKFAFCGDLILMAALGRTNFPTSSSSDMYHSLQLLGELIATDTLLCPSHDYNNEFVTTIAAECQRNVILNDVMTGTITNTEFCDKKVLIDKQLNDHQGSEIICGAALCGQDPFVLKEYNAASLAKQVTQDDSLMLIDIREPHEYALNHAQEFDHNVPLTRLVDFIGKQNHNKNQAMVLACRSGSRSQLAAQALARLGFRNIGHLKGGYALASLS